MFNYFKKMLESYINLGFDISSVKGGIPRLIESAKAGSDQVLLSPFGEQNNPEQLLKDWDAIFQSNLSMMSDELIEIEAAQRSKYGPRSIQKNWEERKADVYSYFSDHSLPKEKIDAIETVIPIAAKLNAASRSLRPLTESNTLKYLKNATNSGLPYFKRKGLIKDHLISDLSKLSELDKEGNTPCVMFTRTQEQGKTRAVWGYPIFHTFNEMRYFQPFLNLERLFNWRSALGGPDVTDRRIQYLMDQSRSDETFISIDFSAYDASINYQLIKLALTFISLFYQGQYKTELMAIASTMSTIGLLTPDGILSGLHGVPSGSTFTNTVDSIVQYLVAFSFYLTGKCTYEEAKRILDLSSIQGDDGAYVVPDKLVEDFYDHFTSYGLKVNIEKSYESKKSVIFLQLLYTKDLYKCGVYPVYRALNRLVYLERFTQFSKDDLTGRDYFGIRAISILENCKNHPLHRELTLFVAANNKYSLLPSAGALQKYEKFVSKRSGADDIIFHQYGQNIGGFYDFETVKILKSNGH